MTAQTPAADVAGEAIRGTAYTADDRATDRRPPAARRRSRWRRPVLLPGGGRWPWWGWLIYLVGIGPLLVAASIPAAALRLAAPASRPIWVFRRRQSAAIYLLLVAGVASLALAAPGAAARTAPLLHRLGAAPAPSVTAEPAPPTRSEAPPAAEAAPPAAPAGGAAPTQATPTARAAAPAAPDAAAAPASRVPSPAATANTGRVVVGNTGGIGVALRQSPRWADRWPGVAWPDRTALVVLQTGLVGDDGAGGTTTWLRVRDPAGHEGYVPARYTVPAS